MTPVRASVPANLAWRTRTLQRLALFLAIFSGSAGFCPAARAQQSKPAEYQVKAVYLFNFGKFVEWPKAATKDDSFPICVLGRDPFGAALDATLAGEKIDDRKLIARRIATERDATGCRILFISSSEDSRIKEILTSMEKSGVLTVSDMPDFIGNGGMIQFVLKENKVRFAVNLTAAQRAGLTFSSQLLKVAIEVKKEPQNEDVNP